MKRWLAAATSISASVVGFSKLEDNHDEKRNRKKAKLEEQMKRAEQIALRFREERGVPGISVGVSVNGKIIWRRGFGYSEVENLTPCDGNTVMRIASISKPLTMFIAAKLMEQGKLDLDAPIQKYVPSFPEKFVNGEKVTLTTRHLVSHLGGIRHYEKPSEATESKLDEASNKNSTTKVDGDKKKSEFQWSEYYNQKQYKSITEALDMFKNDPLLAKPGTKFHYTTHGWTLVSAVIEGAAGDGAKFENLLVDTLKRLNMNHTYLDSNRNVIGGRSQFYRRAKQTGRLENVPSVNNSYKLAGGGLLSTVGDLLTFADVMMTSYRNETATDRSTIDPANYLKSETVTQMWTPIRNTKCSWEPRHGSYAMGWCVVPAFDDGTTTTTTGTNENGLMDYHSTAMKKRFWVSHTGGAVGATCILLIKPANGRRRKRARDAVISVAVLTNLQECGGINQLAHDIANAFDS